MAEWRRLEADDVRAILTSFGHDDYRTHVAIRAGTINTNIRVDTATRPLFLRVNEGKSLDDVKREAAIIAHLGRRVPTPKPRLASDGQPFVLWRDQIVSLFEWVNGDILSRDELEPVHAADVGNALANLHVAGADFGDRRPGRYEPAEIDSRLVQIAALRRVDLSQAVTVLVPELALLQTERAPELPMGLIHGDLFVDNVLFENPALDVIDGIDAKAEQRASLDDSTTMRLRALLDFEQASWGRLAYDLAVTVLAFGFGRDDFRPELVRALLDAYAAVRPPNDAERAAFPAELRFAACRFAITRITDVHLKQGTGAAPGKRYQRYLDRLARIHDHLANDSLLSL
jgi:homoserine kinase type II